MADRDPALDAVRWALGTYLDPQDAQQAATLWQPMAPGQSSLVGLSRFCRNVAQRFNLQGREAELHLHIIRALQRQKTATLPEGRPARPPDPPDDSAHVVRALVLAMQAQASEALGDAFDAPAWRQSAARHVSSARGSEAVKAQAQARVWHAAGERRVRRTGRMAGAGRGRRLPHAHRAPLRAIGRRGLARGANVLIVRASTTRRTP